MWPIKERENRHTWSYCEEILFPAVNISRCGSLININPNKQEVTSSGASLEWQDLNCFINFRNDFFPRMSVKTCLN